MGPLKAIAALTLLSPFVPLMFQGEEWGASTPFLYFTDHQDAELGRRVAEGRSKEFSAFRWQGAVPNPQELRTFERSKLDWSELSKPRHAELLAWYRQLIGLRHDRPEMPRESRADAQRPRVSCDEAAQWLTFVHNGVLVALNWHDRAQRVPMPRGDWNLVMRSDAAEGLPEAMPARTTFIYIGG
jgi:maltooligosyltrehalose trehalohydrolase